MADEMVLQVGVKIAIVQDGKILLLKRADGKYLDIKQDRWDIVGGRINAGTPLLENLKREVHEETKMELVGTPKLIAAQDILKSPEKHVVRLTYVGQATGDVQLDEDHDGYKWMNAEEVNNLGENLDEFFRNLFQQGLIPLA